MVMSYTNPHKPAISLHHNYRHKLPESAALLLTTTCSSKHWNYNCTHWRVVMTIRKW